MDSANNSSSHQSSSGGDEEFNSHAFFATTNNHSMMNIHNNNNNISIRKSNNINSRSTSNNNNNFSIRNINNNLSFLDSLSFFDPSSSSFPLLSPTPPNPNLNPNPNPPTKTTPTQRNPKKRSRASRRTPTTVLTTDTSNFRAMVQEFTGIPSPPFSSSSASLYPSRSRFDFSAPPFLLKPYPQKLQLPAVLNASRATNSLVNYQMPLSSSNIQSFLQSQHLDSGIAEHTGQPSGLIGSGWSPDPIQYGIMGSTKVNNEEINKGGDQARGEGMVESWICSSD